MPRNRKLPPCEVCDLRDECDRRPEANWMRNRVQRLATCLVQAAFWAGIAVLLVVVLFSGWGN